MVGLPETVVSSVKSRKLGFVPNVQHAVDISLEGVSREPKLPPKILSQWLAVMDLC